MTMPPLQIHVLVALDRFCIGSEWLAVPEITVQLEVNTIAPSPATIGSVRAACASLEERRLVASAHDTKRGTLWKITAQGRALLSE